LRGKDFCETIDFVQQVFQTEQKNNKQKYGCEFIPFNPEIHSYICFSQNGLLTDILTNEKVLHIPYPYFMTVEYCLPKKDKPGYNLGVYIPSNTSIEKKCGLFKSDKEDNAMHRNEYIEIIYVYKGQHTVQIENQKIVLKQKEMCIFDTNCAQLDIRSESEGIIVFLGFRRSLIEDYLVNNLTNEIIRDFFKAICIKKTNASYLRLKAAANHITTVEENLSIVFQELERANKGYEMIALICTLRMLNCFEKSSESSVTTIPKNLTGSKLFHTVTEYIKENIADISVEKLRKRFHYQSDYYNRLIIKNTGLTFSEYIRILKLEKAKYFLLNTNMTTNEIITLLGYKSHSYFFKIFREETNLTPTEFRKFHQ
jgi:AraC-like DNA-binding protein